MTPDTAFAIDTFVSSDTPVDPQRLAGAMLGRGAVLRGSTAARSSSRRSSIASSASRTRARFRCSSASPVAAPMRRAFSAGGAIDVGLSWPGRYSHSPVEVMDRRDLDALVDSSSRWRRTLIDGRLARDSAPMGSAPSRSGSCRAASCLGLSCPMTPSDAEDHRAGYGTWKSPLTAARVTAGALRFDHLVLDGDDVYWLEGRASEGGRNVIVRRTPDGRMQRRDAGRVQRALARARVRRRGLHGRIAARSSSRTSTISGSIGRTGRRAASRSRQRATSTPTASSMRRASGCCACARTTRKRRSASRSTRSSPSRCDGRRANEVLVSRRGFLFGSRCSVPTGTTFAWLQWDHPNMPWDGTELWVGGRRRPTARSARA